MANKITDRKCNNCQKIMKHMVCPVCNVRTIVYRTCYNCGLLIWGENLRVTSPTGSVRCINCEKIYHHSIIQRRRKR
jgi:hypothetical protein